MSAGIEFVSLVVLAVVALVVIIARIKERRQRRVIDLIQRKLLIQHRHRELMMTARNNVRDMTKQEEAEFAELSREWTEICIELDRLDGRGVGA